MSQRIERRRSKPLADLQVLALALARTFAVPSVAAVGVDRLETLVAEREGDEF
jgi:hypothetical protein